MILFIASVGLDLELHAYFLVASQYYFMHHSLFKSNVLGLDRINGEI